MVAHPPGQVAGLDPRPVRAAGRVYGTVYSGLDLGFAVSAPVFGWLMDHHVPAGIFAGAAACLALGIASATLVGQLVAARRAHPPTASA